MSRPKYGVPLRWGSSVIGFYLGLLVTLGPTWNSLRVATFLTLVYFPLSAFVQTYRQSSYRFLNRSIGLLFAGFSTILFFGWLTGRYPSVLPGVTASVLGVVSSEGTNVLLNYFRTDNETKTNRTRVLIVGAGEAGEMVASEIMDRSAVNREVVGFLDDDPAKQDRLKNGLPVLGTTDRLSTIVSEYDIDEIIIAMPSVSGDVIRSIVTRATETSATLRIVPGIRKIIEGDVHWNQIRTIKPEDLLGRETVTIDRDRVAERLRGKTVFVTGAAGSIGRHLVRELLQYPIKKVLGVDINESDLYEMEVSELKQSQQSNFESALLDLRRSSDVDDLMKQFEPDYVLHAAALKHVPMVERNPEEAIRTNVLGTANVAESARRVGVSDFIFISTDKAVEPRNVMGHTKRIGERYVAALQELAASTRYVSVRFGNVLGSRGSVVPLFKRQIEEGGPVTITDPDMVRYFMTPGEAVKLVLTASTFEDEGVTYVLEMGDPIPIMDLARQMIALSGYEPETEIPIEIIGMREGETLREKLYAEDESARETEHSKIRNVQVPALSERDLEEFQSLLSGTGMIETLRERFDSKIL